jgi:hypothetical protein
MFYHFVDTLSDHVDVTKIKYKRGNGSMCTFVRLSMDPGSVAGMTA